MSFPTLNVNVEFDGPHTVRAKDVGTVVFGISGEPKQASRCLVPLDVQLAQETNELGDDAAVLLRSLQLCNL